MENLYSPYGGIPFKKTSSIVPFNMEHVQAEFLEIISNSFIENGYTVEKKYDENGVVLTCNPPIKNK